jgi:hypothetical protein
MFTRLLVLVVLGILAIQTSLAKDRNCRTYVGADLPEGEVALLTFKNNISSLYLFDGELVSPAGECNLERFELLPGEHTIHFVYQRHRYDPSRGRNPASFTFTVEQGHAYDLVVRKFDQKYTCKIEDVSTQEVVVEKKDCEAGNVEAHLEIQRAQAMCGDMDAVFELVDRWKVGVIDKYGPVEAYFWCRLIEKTYRWEDAFQCKSFLFGKISKEEIEEAEQRLSSWHPASCPPNLY